MKDHEVEILAAYINDFRQRHPELSLLLDVVYPINRDIPGEARQHGDQIWIGDKFWELDEAAQDYVFAHELGHYVLTEKVGSERFLNEAEQAGLDPWNTDQLPWGQFNWEEAWADTFATNIVDPNESRHRKWRDLVRYLVRTASVDPYQDLDSDIRDALEHAQIEFDIPYHESLDPDDFETERITLSVEDLWQYDDLSSWLETSPGELVGASREEVLDWARVFRPGWSEYGYEFWHTVDKVLRTGIIPAIVIVDTPEYTGIGDGRGRVNLAVALGIEEVPAVILTPKKRPRTADFPSHPETVIIPETDLSGQDIDEEEIWNYYDSVKDLIVEQTVGRLTTLLMKVNGTVVQRNKGGDSIRIDTVEDFETYNNGRMVEVHPEIAYEDGDDWVTDVLFCDLDPKDGFPWNETKTLAADVHDLLLDEPDIEDVTIKYSGGRGFHILGHLTAPIQVDEARARMKELLEPLEDEKVKLGIVREDDMLRLDTTLMKRRGSLRGMWSLNAKTGLVAIPVDVEELPAFEKEQARIGDIR